MHGTDVRYKRVASVKNAYTQIFYPTPVHFRLQDARSAAGSNFIRTRSPDSVHFLRNSTRFDRIFYKIHTRINILPQRCSLLTFLNKIRLANPSDCSAFRLIDLLFVLLKMSRAITSKVFILLTLD